MGLVCPSALEISPHSQRKNLLLPGVTTSIKALICVGNQFPVRPTQSPWKHFHPLFSSGMSVGREELTSGEKPSHVQIPCCPLPSLLPITRAWKQIYFRNDETVSSVFQAGMALYKIVPKNPYYFWSVMSLIMQVCAVLGLTLAAVAVLVQKCSEGKY